MISCELFTRAHHYLQYGLFNPVYKQTIHYSQKSLDLAQAPKHKAVPTDKYDLILSGGSVACSYGITNYDFGLDHLLSSKSIGALNICQEGFTLKDEIDAIQKLKPKDKTIVLLTGFNDAFLIENIKTKQKLRKRLLDKLYPLSKSLFVFKLVYKLTPTKNKLFSRQEYLSQLSRLKHLAIKNRVIVLHQPYLSLNKNKSLSEQHIFNQQTKHLQSIDFQANRDFIQQELSTFEVIDLQSYYEKDRRNLFTDLCHLTELGNDKLAKFIVRVHNDK